MGRIPLLSVLAYAEFYDFDNFQTEDLVAYIRAMDHAYIQSIKDKTPKPDKGKKKGWFK